MSSRPEMIERRREAVWALALVFFAAVAAVDFSITGAMQPTILCKPNGWTNITVNGSDASDLSGSGHHNVSIPFPMPASTLLQNIQITTWMYVQAAMFCLVVFLVYTHGVARDRLKTVMVAQILTGLFLLCWGIVGACIVWNSCWPDMVPTLSSQLMGSNVVFDIVLSLVYIVHTVWCFFEEVKVSRRAGARNTGRASVPKV